MNIKWFHPVLHVIARYILAIIMLIYGIGKILGTQFSSSPLIWDKTIGELTGFELAWFFYGYSYSYGIFIAIIQISASFLLFFRRTTRLGIVIYLSIIINILVVDLVYGIDAAIGIASILTIIALYVFLSDFQAFKDFFFYRPPLFEKEDRPNWLNRLSRFKYICLVISILGLFTLIYILKNDIKDNNEFYGVWKPNDHEIWDRVYFKEGSTFSIRGKDDFDELFSGKYIINRDRKEIELILIEKDYLEEGTFIFTSDSTRMKPLLKGKYEFTSEGIQILNDSIFIRLIKLN